MTTQSKFGDLNSDKQILYLVQWFAEFSEFQRLDFLNDYLFEFYWKFFQKNLFKQNVDEHDDNDDGQQNDNETKEIDDTQITNGDNDEQIADEMNESLQISTKKPPSIFECRMKLFKEWYHEQWQDDDRIEFLLRLKNVDSEFVWNFYRKLLEKEKLLNNEAFQSFINNNDVNDDHCKRLAQRLDMFNDKIFNRAANDSQNQHIFDLTINGFNQSESKPDLLANCHTQQQQQLPEQQQPVNVENDQRNNANEQLLNLDNENTPDLLA